MPFSSVFAEQRLKLIRKLATARKLGEIPYDELVQLVGKQPQSETVVIVQSVVNLVAELGKLSEHCDFRAT